MVSIRWYLGFLKVQLAGAGKGPLKAYQSLGPPSGLVDELELVVRGAGSRAAQAAGPGRHSRLGWVISRGPSVKYGGPFNSLSRFPTGPKYPSMSTSKTSYQQ